MSKVEEAIRDPSAKTSHKLLLAVNRCWKESWHSQTILLLTEINKTNTGDAAWLSPDERETLKYTHTGWRTKRSSWFHAPETSDYIWPKWRRRCSWAKENLYFQLLQQTTAVMTCKSSLGWHTELLKVVLTLHWLNQWYTDIWSYWFFHDIL